MNFDLSKASSKEMEQQEIVLGGGVGVVTEDVLRPGEQLNRVTAPGVGGATSFADSGGVVLTNVRVQLIFWGSAWGRNPTPSINDILNATNTILWGPYMLALTQYRGIGPGTLNGTTTVTTAVGNSPADPPNPFSDGDVSNLISNLITANQVPDPASNDQLLYLVIMPVGVRSSGNFSGEHTYFTRNSQNVHFGWVTNGGTLDSVTAILSHELVESCTDSEGTAILGLPGTCSQSGWCEIGDVCEGNNGVLDGITVQKYWSQRDGACILPARSTFPLQATVSSLGRTENHLDVFTVGNDDGVYSTWWDANATNARWNLWFRIRDDHFGDGFTIDQHIKIASVARQPQHIDLFVVGKDDAVYSNWWDANANNGAWNNWFRIADPHFGDGFTVKQTSTISAIARQPNHLDLFVVGKDDGVYSNWWDVNANNAAWNNWFRIADPHFGDGFTVNQGSYVTSVARQPNHLDLFVVGKDDGVYSNWWDVNANNAAWNNWFRIADPHFGDGFTVNQGSVISAVGRQPNHLDLFVVGKDGAVYSSWWDANANNAAWNGWFRIADPNFGDGFTVNQGSIISAVARQPNHLDLFVIGKDGAMYSSWWDANANNGAWNGWFRI